MLDHSLAFETLAYDFDHIGNVLPTTMADMRRYTEDNQLNAEALFKKYQYGRLPLEAIIQNKLHNVPPLEFISKGKPFVGKERLFEGTLSLDWTQKLLEELGILVKQ